MAVPAGDHLVSSANMITVRIDESVIVTHQSAEAFNVVRVDAVDEGEDGFGVGLIFTETNL